MKRYWCVLALLMTLLIAGQAQVIAAPNQIDQPGDGGQIAATAPHSSEAPIAQGVFHSTVDPNEEHIIAINVAELFAMAAAAAGLILFFWRGWHRVRDAPNRPAAFSPFMAFALLIGMFITARLGAVIAVKLAGIPVEPDGSMPDLTLKHMAQLQLGVYAGQLSVVVGYFWLRGRASVEADRRMTHIKAGLIGVAGLLIAWPAALAAGMLISIIRGQPTDPIAHDVLRELVSSQADVWWTLIVGMAVIVAPVFEEITYRGILQHGLVQAGTPRWLSIAFTSAVFALMHVQSVDPHAIAALFVLSLGFGYVYEKTGRLTAPIVMHMLFNAGNLVMSHAMTST